MTCTKRVQNMIRLACKLNQTVWTREAVGIFGLNVMLKRKCAKHTLGLNEDAHLEINQKNENNEVLDIPHFIILVITSR